MQHSFIRKKNELVTLFAKTNYEEEECIVVKIREDNSFVDTAYIHDIQQIKTDLFSTDIILPDEDCTLCILFKNQPIVVAVGEPKKRFIYYRVSDDQVIPFIQFSYSGEIVDNGDMAGIRNGFYMHSLIHAEPSIIQVDNKVYPVKFPRSVIATEMDGSILLQNNVWQLVAIPKTSEKVKEYFVDRLALKYSVEAEDMIEICTAYFGDENRFRSYIPGVTDPLTSNNFPLIYSDNANNEVTGFWVKTKDLTGIVPDVDNVIFEWNA